MSVQLDKVDVIRERMAVGYQDALSALEQAEGDLVKALVLIEQWLKEKEEESSLNHLIEEAIEDVQKALKTPIRKVRVKLGNSWMKEFPVALTAAAAVSVALTAFLINRCTVEVEHEEPAAKDEG
jgi:hypothetical protein